MSRYTKLTKLYLNLKSLMNCFLRLRLYFVFTVYKVFNKYFFLTFKYIFTIPRHLTTSSTEISSLTSMETRLTSHRIHIILLFLSKINKY